MREFRGHRPFQKRPEIKTGVRKKYALINQTNAEERKRATNSRRTTQLRSSHNTIKQHIYRQVNSKSGEKILSVSLSKLATSTELILISMRRAYIRDIQYANYSYANMLIYANLKDTKYF